MTHRVSIGDGSVRAAYAWLSRACEPGHRSLWAYVAAQGAVEVARQLRTQDAPGELQRAVGERAAADQSMADLERAAAVGARLIIPGDEDWPEESLQPMRRAAANGLSECVPPLALWVRGHGRLRDLVETSVAMVGARACTPYGEQVAHRIGAELSDRGVCLVSGGAFGIDAAAHRAALSSGQPTLAVLACGADRAYPKAHEQLLDRITQNGLLLSEWPPGAAPMRQRFLVRNRLIAGLTADTVVVEAALRSGARSTAARARDMGKPVMAVPGPVTSAMSAGTLALLRDAQAIPVGSAAHILEMIGRVGVDLAAAERGPDRPHDDLDPRARQLLEAVPLRRRAPLESVARVAGMPISEATGWMSVLELAGAVECDEHGWRRSSPQGTGRHPPGR